MIKIEKFKDILKLERKTVHKVFEVLQIKSKKNQTLLTFEVIKCFRRIIFMWNSYWYFGDASVRWQNFMFMARIFQILLGCQKVYKP